MLFGIVMVAAGVYVGVCLLLYLLQGRVLFPATKRLYRTPAAFGWAYEDVRVSVGEETTHAWYISAPEPRRGVVLFSHGNAGNIADRLESCSIFRNLGFDTLVYDYGGYGQSTGKPTEQRLYNDIRAMWTYLVEERREDPARIFLFGRSLGGAPTAQLATEVKAAGVVLESTFMSVPKRAREMFPYLPVKWLVRYRFDTASKVGRIQSPLLLIHSRDDRLIPYHHGLGLRERAPEDAESFDLRGDHNESFVLTGDAYVQRLDAFFTKHAPPDAAKLLG